VAILIVTLEVPQEAREVLKAEAAPLISIADVHEVVLLSADIHSFMKVLADALDWTLPFKAAVGIFLTELAKNMADDLWKNKVEIAKALGSAAAFPIRKLIGAIAKAREISGERTTFAVGVPVPDDHYGATVTLLVDSTEDSAVTFAIFVHHSQEIERTLKRYISAGSRIVGPVRIRPEPDGSVVLLWMDRVSQSAVQVRLPFTLPEDASSQAGNLDLPLGGARD